jgi:MFS family permease
MSRVRRAVAGLLVGLYPQAWRKRYRVEMLALIEDDPPGLGGLASLVAGAVDAHVRPRAAWSEQASPLARMRVSVVGMFCCWIALSVVGAGFQKETEEAAFGAAGERHHALAIAHGAVIAGAALGALAIAIGGLPLVWEAVGDAWRRRDWRLAGLLGLPVGTIACFAALTWLLLAPSSRSVGQPAHMASLAIFVPWLLGGLACAAACALAPRMVLVRAAVSRDSLARASLAGIALAVAMSVISIALLVYVVALTSFAPGLSGQTGGPLGPTTGAMLAAGTALAVASTGLALVSCRRAVRARALPVR